MADAFWTEVFAQSRQVEANNERERQRQEAAEQRRVGGIVAQVRVKLGLDVAEGLPGDTHRFSPYGYPGLSGCVRCHHPEDHPVHRARR